MPCDLFLSGFFSISSEEAKKGKKKKKESDKPDSFTEKMVVHLMKNLLVRTRLDSLVHSTCKLWLLLMGSVA